MRLGSASIQFEHGPSVIAAASAVGPKEGEGPLGPLFDFIDRDGTMEQKSWEEAESELQKKALQLAVEKAAVPRNRIRYLFAGDLLGQCVASSFGLKETAIPLFGLYGACSTMGESLSLAAMTLAAGYAEYALCVTSSHYASAERQFRFPSDYGNQRPASATWTVTGSGAVVLGTEDGSAGEGVSTGGRTVRITGITTGRIVDYGVKDSMNMGAAMAPAAADTIFNHIKNTNSSPDDYDLIVTGDLGSFGSRILKDLLWEKGMDVDRQHVDCGEMVFNMEESEYQGGSGAGCSALVFCSYIYNLIKEKKYKKILLAATGALLSSLTTQQGESIPSISHAVEIGV